MLGTNQFFKRINICWYYLLKEWKGQLPFITLCSWDNNSHVHFFPSALELWFLFAKPDLTRSLSPVFLWETLSPCLFLVWFGFFCERVEDVFLVLRSTSRALVHSHLSYLAITPKETLGQSCSRLKGQTEHPYKNWEVVLSQQLY